MQANNEQIIELIDVLNNTDISKVSDDVLVQLSIAIHDFRSKLMNEQLDRMEAPTEEKEHVKSIMQMITDMARMAHISNEISKK